MKQARYLFPADYMADPAAHVFNGRVYIYPSHDRDTEHCFDDDGGHFQMRDYHVLSLDNIETGDVTDHGVVLDVDQVPWAEKQMWDSDVVEKNGKYYMIFSAKDYTGLFHLGVAVADKPEGPFIPEPAPIIGSYSIDPCAFKDDDGEVYVYFGGIWGGQLQWYKNNRLNPREVPAYGEPTPDGAPADYLTQVGGGKDALPSAVARLTDDCMQFAETPRPVVIVDNDGNPLKADDPHRFFEASWMHKIGKTYYFSYSTGDSHLLCYATGDNPYGPFTFQGELLQPVVGWTTHHCIMQHNGKWYLFHHDCVPSNDVTWLRSLKVIGLEVSEDGKMKIEE